MAHKHSCGGLSTQQATSKHSSSIFFQGVSTAAGKEGAGGGVFRLLGSLQGRGPCQTRASRDLAVLTVLTVRRTDWGKWVCWLGAPQTDSSADLFHSVLRLKYRCHISRNRTTCHRCNSTPDMSKLVIDPRPSPAALLSSRSSSSSTLTPMIPPADKSRCLITFICCVFPCCQQKKKCLNGPEATTFLPPPSKQSLLTLSAHKLHINTWQQKTCASAL